MPPGVTSAAVSSTEPPTSPEDPDWVQSILDRALERAGCRIQEIVRPGDQKRLVSEELHAVADGARGPEQLLHGLPGVDAARDDGRAVCGCLSEMPERERQ